MNKHSSNIVKFIDLFIIRNFSALAPTFTQTLKEIEPTLADTYPDQLPLPKMQRFMSNGIIFSWDGFASPDQFLTITSSSSKKEKASGRFEDDDYRPPHFKLDKSRPFVAKFIFPLSDTESFERMFEFVLLTVR